MPAAGRLKSTELVQELVQELQDLPAAGRLKSTHQPERTTHRMQPPRVQHLLSVRRARCAAVPGSTMCVLWVFPLWLNAVLEQIVCGAGLQLAGGLDVVVQTATAVTVHAGTRKLLIELLRPGSWVATGGLTAAAIADAAAPAGSAVWLPQSCMHLQETIFRHQSSSPEALGMALLHRTM